MDYAGRALRLATEISNPEWQGIAGRVLAQVRVRTGDVVAARQLFEDSIDVLSQSENRVALARCHHQIGLFLAEQPGEERSAREHLELAAELFAAAGADEQAARVRAALGS